MKSSDKCNIFINEAPNHHAKQFGYKFYPECELKQMVNAAKMRELQSPAPPSIKAKVLECEANYKDNRVPKHQFKKTDMKGKALEKRQKLEEWIKEENNLRKGIQRPKSAIKQPPKAKSVQKQEDEWPDIPENKGETKEDNYDEEEEK